MVTRIGKLTTAVISKFGFCSQKAAIRLASETGRQMVDKSIKLGRNLTTTEIKEVFNQKLPKKLRPEIITDKAVFAKELMKSGLPQEGANDLVNNPQVLGAALTMGKKKASIFFNPDNAKNVFEQTNLVNCNSLYAHELEHAIQRNNTLKGILKRYITEPTQKFFIKDLKSYLKKLNQDNINFQMNLQQIAALPTSEQTNAIKTLLANSANGSKKKLKNFKHILNLEIPAYTAGAKVEHYGVRKNQFGYEFQEIVRDIYSKALNILKGKE